MQLAGWFTSISVMRLWQAAAGEADPTAVARLCAEGEEAADFIRTYVVQARLNERGNYGDRPAQCSSRQAAGSQEQPLAPVSCASKLLLLLHVFQAAWMHGCLPQL